MKILSNGINDILFQHFAISEGGVAEALRYSTKGLIENLSIFLLARTDLKRLLAAEAVAEVILKRNDLEDLLEIRRIVAKQELKHHINYINQQDHTAHTIYVYLLGIWFYDNISIIRQGVMNNIKNKNVDGFLFQWVYASLLHDIGYVFYSLTEETDQDREGIAKIYSWEWIEKQKLTTDAHDNKLTILKKIHSEWESKYGEVITIKERGDKSVDEINILNKLSAVPWLGELFPKWKKMTTFQIFDEISLLPGSLQKYAYTVAKTGYEDDEKKKCIDHAVASGLLLFQYSSYWYFLMNRLTASGKKGKDEFDKIASPKGKSRPFNYDLRNVENEILPACRSVAHHNIQPKVENTNLLIKNITLKNDPITFLSVLCDEIQKWDRFNAQKGKWIDPLQFAKETLEASELEIKVIADETFGQTARVRIHNNDFPSSKLRSDLDNRLPGWKDVLSITSVRDGYDKIVKLLKK